jgi:hypothetical protein
MSKMTQPRHRRTRGTSVWSSSHGVGCSATRRAPATRAVADAPWTQRSAFAFRPQRAPGEGESPLPHLPQRTRGGAVVRQLGALLSGVRRRRAGWTVDTSACVCTRERRPLSCGAPSRTASSGGPTRTRRISAAARLTASLRCRLGPACESPCVERPARQLRGPCAFDHCCDPAGPLRFRPGGPGPAQPPAPKPISLPSRSR